MISSDLEGVKNVGLRPSRKIKLFNGKLECRFLQYEMYEGTKKFINWKSKIFEMSKISKAKKFQNKFKPLEK
jgi:hypothetical protein